MTAIKKKEDLQRNRICVYLTDSELEHLKHRAKHRGLSTAKYIKLRAFWSVSIVLILMFQLISPVAALSPRKACVNLKNSHELRLIAKKKAYDMDKHNYWAHRNPATGKNLSFEIKGSYSEMGETLAIGYKTMEEVCESWMNSPTHKAILTDPEYDDYGIFIKRADLGEKRGWLVVLVLGKLKQGKE